MYVELGDWLWGSDMSDVGLGGARLLRFRVQDGFIAIPCCASLQRGCGGGK